MKKITLFILFVLAAYSVISQDISGYWNGLLQVQGKQFRIGFEFTKKDSVYTAFMDSPDQGVNRIKVSKTTLKDKILKLEITESKVQYTGNLGEMDTIVGNLKQGEQVFPLNFSKGVADTLVRPQEPKGPFSYYTENIKFENKADKIILGGTLTLPKKVGIFPVVVLISDKGAQNRNGEMYDHKTFLVLADYLTKNGVAVLRYDDRGTGQSTGDFKTATTADFKNDVEAALLYLQTRKEIKKEQIGLIGHGEGAIIAPMVAAKNSDINFMILLAGTGLSADKSMIIQEENLSKAMGMKDLELKKNIALKRGAYDVVLKYGSSEKLKVQLKSYYKEALKDSAERAAMKPSIVKIDSSRLNLSKSDSLKFVKLDSIKAEKLKLERVKRDKYISQQVEELSTPWMQHYINISPESYLEKVKCPVLILNGSKDTEVPPIVNLDAIITALKKGGNSQYDSKAFPNTNHLFQNCKTGLVSEYKLIEQTISPLVLSEISKWIKLKTTPIIKE